MIPNNIIQIHSNYSDLNLFERVSVERWNLLNPSWDYKFIIGDSLDSYIKRNWPDHFEQYSGFQTIQKAAIQRIAAVHKHGGVYADCDVYPIKKADTFTQLKSSANFYNLKKHSNYNGDLIADYIFAAEKESGLLNDLILEIFKRTNDLTVKELNGWSGFVYETCSIHCFSEVVFSSQYKPKFFDGCDNHIKDLESKPSQANTYHYSSESWIEDNRFKRDKKNKQLDQLQHLDVIKQIYGI